MAATAGTDTAFAEAVAADEGFALAHISLARAKQLMGRGHEAKAPRARALELAPTASPREQSHIAIFDKILTGRARRRWRRSGSISRAGRATPWPSHRRPACSG